MLCLNDELLLKLNLGYVSALVFQHTAIVLLLADSFIGQSQGARSSQTIVTLVGEDVTLPCHLEPAVDAVSKSVEWGRLDLEPRFVHVWHQGQNILSNQNPSYKGRTLVSTEKLKHGDLSLTLSAAKLSDNGIYRCYFPLQSKEYTVELVVGSVSSAVIAGIYLNSSAVMLQCESAGWYPEPEVLWLDGEGKLLSAGPTETVRGPDDLYTVSSRVTVEKRHNNSFTCRVQQRNINQTRETHVQVPDDFFKVQSSSPVITGLAVSLAVCIVMPIVLLLVLLWKRRQKIIRTKRSHCDETEKGKKKKSSPTNKSEDQSVPVEEREHLMTAETVEMKDLKPKTNECVPGQHGASSPTRPVIVHEVNAYGKCINLRNTSSQEQQLKNWEIHVQFIKTKPIIYKFDDSLRLKSGETVRMWPPGHHKLYGSSPNNLEWRNLKSWRSTDQLQIKLISSTGETKHFSCYSLRT